MIALVGGALMVGLACACIAALLRLKGFVAFVVGVAVLAFAEVVAVSHVLSIWDAYERGMFLVALAVVSCGAAAAVCVARPGWPSLRVGAPLRDVLVDPLMVVLTVVVAVELGYLLVLTLLTPPTEYDVLTYHLTRAAFWIQRESVGFNADATYRPTDEFPPGAEILQSATMLLSRSIRYVGLVQFAALLCATLAIYGVAVRVGFGRRAAAFGALVFPTLPVVALQAPTALNDLVVAALVAAATFFSLGRSRGELLLAGVCVALLVETKVTAALALPVLLLVALLAARGRSRAVLLGTGAAGIVLGSAWYLANATRENDTFGSAGHTVGARDGPVAVVARTTRYLVQAVELPGAGGRGVYLYLVVAGFVLVIGGVAMGWRRGVVAAAFVAATAATLSLERLLHSIYFNGWELVGFDTATQWGIIRESTVASNLQSWYGPVGLALAAISLALVTRAVVRKEARPVTLALVTAPLILVLGTAIVTGYHPFSGRFAMGAVALSAATWGIVRSWTPGATAVIAVSATTVFLSVVNYSERSAGIEFLGGTDRPSIWTLPRPWAQSLQPEVAQLIHHIDRHAVRGTTIGLTRDPVIYPFAYVGYPDIEHEIVYADDLAEATRRGADWAVLPLTAGCEAGWHLELRSPPWGVYRQVSGARCR